MLVFCNRAMYSISGHNLKIGLRGAKCHLKDVFDIKIMEIALRGDAGQLLKGRECLKPNFSTLPSLNRLTDLKKL